MRPDPAEAEGTIALAPAPLPAPASGAPDDAARLAGITAYAAWWRGWLPARERFGARSGGWALGTLVILSFAVVVFATAQDSQLVPRSFLSFPHWEAGPLHGLFGHLTHDDNILLLGLSAVIVLMGAAYGVVLLSVRSLSMRRIWIGVVALHLILLLAPPMQLTDVFNYLGYARLGAIHHLNPYTHGMVAEMHDPIYRFSTWHHLHSPYGPLFTALTYPVALLGLPASYWVLKTVVVALALAFLALVWKCAKLLGRDARFAVAFVAFNPVYLMYAITGFHNDFFMLVPSMAAVTLLLAHRDRPAGAALMVAVAVKFTAILLLPFLLIAARPPGRRLRLLSGFVIALVPLAIMQLVLFGTAMPNLRDQSTLLTDFSVPNLVGLLLGLGGGTSVLLRVANVLVVLCVLHLLRRQRDLLSGAGWATLALLASLAWLVPWYIVWVLPLAALGSSPRLRRATIAFTVFLVVTFIPATAIYLRDHGIDPMGSAVGQASKALQRKLEQ